MDEATLFDSFFNYLQQIDVFPFLEHLDPQKLVTHYLNDPAGDRLRTRIVENGRQSVVGEEWVDVASAQAALDKIWKKYL